MATPGDNGADARRSTETPGSAGQTSLSTRDRSGTATSTASPPRGRAGSLSMRFLESSPPMGMWHATGNALAAAPTPLEIRQGAYSHDGWDAPVQRRNSVSSNEGRLSRVSTGQTPASLARANTFLGTHTEAEEEHTPVPATGASASSQQKATRAEDDEDDPFSKFIGRAKLGDQSYDPNAKRSKADDVEVDPLDENADDNDVDSLEDLDPRRPVKRNSALPKKFLDPTEKSAIKPPIATTTTTNPTTSSSQTSKEITAAGPDADGVYPTGYKFPPKHTWGEATVIGLKAFWKFTLTPFGFLIVIYGLNVVAWGGMLFLLLIGGGAEFMCFPKGAPPGYKDCNDLQSPRRIWIEIDSQILNALFCVTGFGLVPWRFRDLYYLMKYRLGHREDGLRKLAGIHRAWFRLPGSDDIPSDLPATIMPDAETNTSIPIPATKAPDPPLTGFRARPTSLWKLDFVIWAYVWNTFLQIVLSVFMWHFNRFTRPSWSTGLFVALACIVAGLGGLMCFIEGKKVKAVEGIPVPEAEELAQIARDVEASAEMGGEKPGRKRSLLKKDRKEKHGGGEKGKERDEAAVR